MLEHDTLQVELEGAVAVVRLHRPQQANSLNADSWRELRSVFEWADDMPQVRCVVLAGSGEHFCAGIDFNYLMSISAELNELGEGRRQERLRRIIIGLQEAITSLERCRKPVLASIHGACVGGGVDLIAACDMRYASTDAYFSVKEVDLGIVADLGSLQRLRGIVGEGMLRELALTGRQVEAGEAYALGLVNKVLEDPDQSLSHAIATAESIAAKSPVTVRGIKQILNYSRDHSVSEGLDYVATWNASMLLSEDLAKAVSAAMQGGAPEFED